MTLPRKLAERIVPSWARERLRRHVRLVTPPVGLVRFGSLDRLTPISRHWGQDRGTAVDRYYIEDFLRRHAGLDGYLAGDLKGRVLEIGDDTYSRKFGGWGQPGTRIEQVDILSADDAAGPTTLVADLADAPAIADQTYDCIICTQTLLLIYDVRAAIRTLHRILKPGGVGLATFPGISKICRPEIDIWGDYWRFTSLSARRLFEEEFSPRAVKVETYGNVFSAIAFLHGLAAEEIKPAKLDLRDPDYEVVIAVRAVKDG